MRKERSTVRQPFLRMQSEEDVHWTALSWGCKEEAHALCIADLGGRVLWLVCKPRVRLSNKTTDVTTAPNETHRKWNATAHPSALSRPGRWGKSGH